MKRWRHRKTVKIYKDADRYETHRQIKGTETKVAFTILSALVRMHFKEASQAVKHIHLKRALA